MGEASEHHYLVALGSNCRVPGVGAPRAVLAAAVAALAESGWEVEAVARVIDSAPVGPSLRRYANGAAIITGDLAPPDALENLQDIEHAFGRNRRGQRWRTPMPRLLSQRAIKSGLTLRPPRATARQRPTPRTNERLQWRALKL